VRPGSRLVQGFLALAVLGTAGAVWAGTPALLGGAAIGLFLLAGMEAWQLRRVPVRVERPATMALSLGEAEHLPLSIAHGARFPIRFVLRCPWPRVLGRGAGWLEGACPAGVVLPLSLEVRGVTRGAEALPPVHLAIRHWGLVERRLELAAPCTVSVLPNLRAVKRLRTALNAYFLRRTGTRTAPRIGQGREFDRLRDYVPGDDFRKIVWKASARARKLIVREFRVERSQDVLLCVDRGHRMAGRLGDLSRNDHAVNAAVLTAYLCNRMEDRTGLLAFGDTVERGVGQGRGGVHLAAVTRFGTGIAPEYVHTDYPALAAHVRRRLKARSLILVLTVLPEAGEQQAMLDAVDALVPRHLPLFVSLRDPALEAAAELLPRNREELARSLVASDLVQARRQLVRELRTLGALVVETRPEDAGVEAVNAYLDVKRRQLL
jgi:uncharacterized protein (DUF58 family)